MAHRRRERKPIAGEESANEKVTLVKARDVLGELASRVEFGGERIVVTRRGKNAFALVNMTDYATLTGAT